MEDRDFIDFKFGDHWASEFNLVAVSSGDRYSPPVYGSVNPNTTTVAGKVGVYKWKSQIGEKVFNINIAFDNINGQTLNQIKEWLHPFKIDKLTFKEEPFKYYWVALNSEPELNFVPFLEETKVVNGIEFKQGIYKGEFNIQFVCFDNYGYSDWQSFDENYDYLAEVVNSTNGVISVNDAMNVETEIGIQGVSRQETRAAEEGKTVEGEMISLSDVDATKEHTFTIQGDSKQEIRNGENLYNFKDVKEKSSGVTVDSNGWITITDDNTQGTSDKYLNYFTNNLNLQTSTNYNIIYEIKSVSGTGWLALVSKNTNTAQGQMNKVIGKQFSQLNNNSIITAIATTKDDFTDVTEGIRTFVSFSAGNSGSITFRISVLEDTTITADTFEYEAYGVAPSFEYPSEIKSVGSNINLFNWETALFNKTINNQGVVSDSNYNFVSDFIAIEPNTVYRVNEAITCVFEFDENHNIISELRNSQTAAAFRTSANAKYLRVRNYYSTGNLTELAKTAKLEKGSKSTLYSPYNQGSTEIKFYNKNIISFGYNKGQTHYYNGMTVEVLDEHRIKINGTATNNFSFDYLLTDYIYYKKGITYTLSCNKISGSFSNQLLIHTSFVNDTQDLWGYSQLLLKEDKASVTFQPEEDGYSPRLIVYVQTGFSFDNLIVEIQLEEGETATEYQDHQSQSYPIYLDKELNGDETVRDRIIRKDGKWCYKFNWGKRIFDGTENWTLQNNAFVITQSDALKVYYGDNQIRVLSNYFMPQKSAYRGEILDLHIAKVIDNNQNQIGIKYSAMATVEEFKAKLVELHTAGNPLYIIYQLAEPIYEEITDETLIAQLDALENSTLYQGTTHISSEDNINLHYNYLTAIPSIKFPSEIKNTENSVNINIFGKNLSTRSSVTTQQDGYLNSLTGDCGYFPANETYTISFFNNTNATEYLELRILDEAKNRLQQINGGRLPANSKKTITFTTTAAGYLTFSSFLGNEYGSQEVFTEIQIEKGTSATEYELPQSQTIIFPLSEGQKLYKGSYLAEDGIHDTRKQIILNGTEEWIVAGTQYDGLFSCYIIQEDMLRSTSTNDLYCTHFKQNDFTIREEGLTKSSSPLNYDFFIFRISIDKVSDLTTWKEILATEYAKGTPVILEYNIKTPKITPYTEEQQEALKNIYLYTGVNNIYVDNAELALTYIPQQNIYIDYMVNCSNLLNDSSFYHENNIYKKSYFDIDTGDAAKSGISTNRPVYLYNAGTSRANLNLIFDLIIPAENSPLIIKTESCKLTDNGIQILNEESLISISNFANFKPFLDIYDDNLDNWQIEIDSELCEVYVKHKIDKTKIISLNKFNDKQSFLSLANCKFVDYLKPFPTSITAISNSAIENTIFNKLSVASSAQNYRLKNVYVDWKHTYI